MEVTGSLADSEPPTRGSVARPELDYCAQRLQIDLLVALLKRPRIEPSSCRRHIVRWKVFPLGRPSPPKSMPEAPVGLLEIAPPEGLFEPPRGLVAAYRFAVGQPERRSRE